MSNENKKRTIGEGTRKFVAANLDELKTEILKEIGNHEYSDDSLRTTIASLGSCLYSAPKEVFEKINNANNSVEKAKIIMNIVANQENKVSIYDILMKGTLEMISDVINIMEIVIKAKNRPPQKSKVAEKDLKKE